MLSLLTLLHCTSSLKFDIAWANTRFLVYAQVFQFGLKPLVSDHYLFLRCVPDAANGMQPEWETAGVQDLIVEVHISTVRGKVFCTAIVSHFLRILKLTGTVLFYTKTIYCPLLSGIVEDLLGFFKMMLLEKTFCWKPQFQFWTAEIQQCSDTKA